MRALIPLLSVACAGRHTVCRSSLHSFYQDVWFPTGSVEETPALDESMSVEEVRGLIREVVQDTHWALSSMLFVDVLRGRGPVSGKEMYILRLAVDAHADVMPPDVASQLREEYHGVERTCTSME